MLINNNMKPNIKEIEDNLENFRAVQYRMGNEGMDYCLNTTVHLMKFKMRSFIN
jgi:hypothetical protein